MMIGLPTVVWQLATELQIAAAGSVGTGMPAAEGVDKVPAVKRLAVVVGSWMVVVVSRATDGVPTAKTWRPDASDAM